MAAMPRAAASRKDWGSGTQPRSAAAFCPSSLTMKFNAFTRFCDHATSGWPSAVVGRP